MLPTVIIGEENITKNAPEFFKDIKVDTRLPDPQLEDASLLLNLTARDPKQPAETAEIEYKFPDLNHYELMEFCTLIDKWSALRGNPRSYGLVRRYQFKKRSKKFIHACDLQTKEK